MQEKCCQNLESVVGNITKVRENIYGIILNEYTNGYETTAGLVNELDINNSVISVTFDSDHSTELPFNWPELQVLDDNNKRQRISKIIFDSDNKAYVMEDGTMSETVTLFYNKDDYGR